MSLPICQLSAAGPWEVKGSPRISSSRQLQLYLSLDPCRGRWWTRFFLSRSFWVLRLLFFFLFSNVFQERFDGRGLELARIVESFFFFFFRKNFELLRRLFIGYFYWFFPSGLEDYIRLQNFIREWFNVV